ncbi:hypothetical protein GGI07_002963 [Coemansia sp. Benny D115]|nr:hypothetical protein GGI07_002963 [Coemansia sp. Benny D115]
MMEAVRPFPSLNSATNSRSASPAPSTASAGASPSSKNEARANKGARRTPKARHKKQAPTQGAEVPQSTKEPHKNAGAQKGEGTASTKGKRPKKPKAATPTAAPATFSSAASSAPASANGDSAPKRQEKKNGASRRRTTAAAAAAAESPEPASAVPQSAPATVREFGALAGAMIVPGENGRARVLFNPQGTAASEQRMEPVPRSASPRFTGPPHVARRSTLGGQFGGRARFPVAYGGNAGLGLGLGSPMSPAPNAGTGDVQMHAFVNTAPPTFRQRSLTSSQHHFPQHSHLQPQQHYPHYHYQQQQQQHHQQQQQQAPPPSRRLSSTGSLPNTQTTASARGRSQSVSTHISLTGLRISMAQSKPGNVLAPHLPLLTRAASGGAVQTNTYANGGYFATRRASMSNTGLAVDANHAIRIPTIMFQKPRPEESAVPADSLATPVTGDSGSGNGSGGEERDAPPSAGEVRAMQKLQDMISSMRALSSKTASTKQQPQPQTQTQQQQQPQQPLSPVSAAEPDVSKTLAPSTAIPMPPTPAAHPTSRFDSILEEDEDDEADEAKLDADADADAQAAHRATTHEATALTA